MFSRSGYSAQTRRCGQPRSITTSDPTCSSVGAMSRAGSARARRRAPRPRLAGAEVRELDHVLLGVRAPSGATSGAGARSARARRDAHGHRLGHVPPAVALAASGSGSAGVLVEGLERVRDRGATRPPARVRGAPRRRSPRARLAQQLDRLHRHRDSAKRLGEVEARGVGDDRLDRQARAAARPASSASSSRRGRARSRRGRRAASRSATRPVPAPTSSTGPPASRASSHHSGRSAS